jgi:hypothetical protein
MERLSFTKRAWGIKGARLSRLPFMYVLRAIREQDARDTSCERWRTGCYVQGSWSEPLPHQGQRRHKRLGSDDQSMVVVPSERVQVDRFRAMGILFFRHSAASRADIASSVSCAAPRWHVQCRDGSPAHYWLPRTQALHRARGAPRLRSQDGAVLRLAVFRIVLTLWLRYDPAGQGRTKTPQSRFATSRNPTSSHLQ